MTGDSQSNRPARELSDYSGRLDSTLRKTESRLPSVVERGRSPASDGTI